MMVTRLGCYEEQEHILQLGSHRLLRLKGALKVTIHGAAFESEAKNARNVLAVEDIKDEVF